MLFVLIYLYVSCVPAGVIRLESSALIPAISRTFNGLMVLSERGLRSCFILQTESPEMRV